jgi:hypothetical protein
MIMRRTIIIATVHCSNVGLTTLAFIVNLPLFQPTLFAAGLPPHQLRLADDIAARIDRAQVGDGPPAAPAAEGGRQPQRRPIVLAGVLALLPLGHRDAGAGRGRLEHVRSGRVGVQLRGSGHRAARAAESEAGEGGAAQRLLVRPEDYQSAGVVEGAGRSAGSGEPHPYCYCGSSLRGSELEDPEPAHLPNADDASGLGLSPSEQRGFIKGHPVLLQPEHQPDAAHLQARTRPGHHRQLHQDLALLQPLPHLLPHSPR